MLRVHAGIGGARALAAIFCALGLAQGSFVPSNSVLIKAWLPEGRARPWALRGMELGSRIAPLVAATTVPVIAAAWGWVAVPRIYGGVALLFACLWQAAARERPAPPQLGTPAARGVCGDDGGGPKHKVAGADGVEWSVFSVAPVQACIASHFASNATIAVMSAWAPTYFVAVLGCTPMQAGGYLALPPVRAHQRCCEKGLRALGEAADMTRGGCHAQLVQNVGNVLVALLENALRGRGVGLQAVRRGMTAGGSAVQAAFLVRFGWARTPLGAACAYAGVTGGHCFRGSGASANYYEVGGQDTAMITSVRCSAPTSALRCSRFWLSAPRWWPEHCRIEARAALIGSACTCVVRCARLGTPWRIFLGSWSQRLGSGCAGARARGTHCSCSRRLCNSRRVWCSGASPRWRTRARC